MSGPAVYTVGHSTRSLEHLINLLKAHSIQTVVDVRTVPRSRRVPQFNKESVAGELGAAGIGYVHMKELGGWRRARKDSPNTGWRNAGFRGYADYMLTDEFEAAVSRLIALAQRERIAIMCAEAVPWRCHRSLIADALTVRGVEVRHISGPGAADAHELTALAKVDGATITYPPTGASRQQPSLDMLS
jgi:uncharacterized protein (DUF488 family)